MASQGVFISEDASVPPAGQDVKGEPNATELQVICSTEARREPSEEEEEEEKKVTSAHLEPSTLPWSADKPRAPDNDQGSSENSASQSKDEEMCKGSPDVPHAHKESSTNSKARWRESMPEGDRWRDEVIEVQQDDKLDSSLADDEAKEEKHEGEPMCLSEKAPLGFTPHVKIVHLSDKEQPEESRVFFKNDEEEQLQMKPDSAAQFYPDCTEEENQQSE